MWAIRVEWVPMLILLFVALFLWLGSRKTWETVHSLHPLTRANTADLPAPGSLVRASSEPVQAQGTVLLRAAIEGNQTPAVELVRASVRGQE